MMLTPAARSCPDQVPGRVPGLRVHAGRGLVEEHELRTADDGRGERQPLLLPAGQPLVRGSRHRGQADEVEQHRDLDRVGVEPAQQVQVVDRGHRRGNAARLEHHPDPWPQRLGVAHRVQAEDAHRALVGPPVALADLDGRGLARAVRPQNAGDRAARRAQRQPVHRRRLAVPLDQAADLDGGYLRDRAHGRESTAVRIRPVRHRSPWRPLPARARCSRSSPAVLVWPPP